MGIASTFAKYHCQSAHRRLCLGLFLISSLTLALALFPFTHKLCSLCALVQVPSLSATASPLIPGWLHRQQMWKVEVSDGLFVGWPPVTKLWSLRKVQPHQRGFHRLIEQEASQKKSNPNHKNGFLSELSCSLSQEKISEHAHHSVCQKDYCHPRIKRWLFGSLMQVKTHLLLTRSQHEMGTELGEQVCLHL